jgi:hypothetical protein
MIENYSGRVFEKNKNFKINSMKKTAAVLSLALLFSCNNSGTESNKNAMQDTAKKMASGMTNGASDVTVAEPVASYKKYDIKSGIVTFETSMQMSGMNIKTKNILYFDDYGIKECQEEYKTDASGKEMLTKRDFVKEGFRYICSIENKGGSKTKAMGYGVASPFNMDEASTMKDNQFKKIPDETVCSKSCNAFSMVTPSGNIKMYGWNRITLKTVVDNPSMKMKTETVATKVEENASIPAEKFEVPKDVKMVDM